MLVTASACAIAVAVIALVELPEIAVIALAFAAGLTFPPIQSAVRTIYPKMVNARMLSPLFSLDASLQELIWIGGPVVVTFVATQLSTVLALMISVVLLIGGGLWFAASPEVGRVRIPRSRRAFGVVLTRPPVLLATIVGLMVIASCAAIEASVPGLFGQHDPASGIVLAIWSIASLGGGLSLGRAQIGPWALPVRLGIVTLGAVFLPIAGHSALPVSVALIVSGFGIAPALGVLASTVSASVKFSDTAEAYGWVGTGQLIGAALGAGVAGALIDSGGGSLGFAAGAGFAVLGLLVAVLGTRWAPDLRGRDASPIPDTAPIPVQPNEG